MPEWTRCSCGHIAQDHGKNGVCGRCNCLLYDGHEIKLLRDRRPELASAMVAPPDPTLAKIEKAMAEYKPGPRVRYSDDQLETELHLLAILLKRHMNLVAVVRYDGTEETIHEVNDFSAELHKSIVLEVRADDDPC